MVCWRASMVAVFLLLKDEALGEVVQGGRDGRQA